MWVNACAPLTTPGRSDPYRIVDDLVETTLALQIAKLAARGLRERLPDAHVLLTREDDSGLSLEARCALANAMGRRLRFDTSQCECRSGSHRLEASFLSHDPEARALTTLRYRRALADGIASGIVDYLHSR